MKSKTAIARRNVGGQHVILRAYSNDELQVRPSNVTPKTFNDFVLARDFDQLMNAIDELGVMSREKFGLAKAKDPLEAYDEMERVFSVREVRQMFESHELLGMDETLLTDEAYLEYVGNGSINKSALRRLYEGYDATKNGFIEQLSDFEDYDKISVEPLQDWMDLRNNIVLAARVKGFYVNPPEVEGCEDGALGSDPLYAAGFTPDDLVRGKIDQTMSSRACFEEYDRQYRRLCSFNTFSARNADSVLSNVRDYFLAFKYQAPLFFSKLGEGEWSTALEAGHSVNYLSAPVATAHGEGKGVRQNYLCVCFKEGEDPRDVALRFLKQMMRSWMVPCVDEDSAFSADGVAKLKVDSLTTALWKMVYFPEDHEIAACKNCGNAFLRPKKGRTKIWCRDSCRVQYSAKRGPEEWASKYRA